MKSTLCLAVALLALGAIPAVAQNCSDCCEQCGCHAQCQKVCRCVPDVKKVPKVTYSCECEDFCVPGPSCRSLTSDCECGGSKYVYTPTCARVRTRKLLVKHETMVEKPGYKWVVEELCGGCANRCAADPAQQASIEPAPRGPSSDVLKASYQNPSSDTAESSTSSAGPSGLKADLRRMLQPILRQK